MFTISRIAGFPWPLRCYCLFTAVLSDEPLHGKFRSQYANGAQIAPGMPLPPHTERDMKSEQPSDQGPTAAAMFEECRYGDVR